MAFREVSVVAIREVLRLWLTGHAVRTIARVAQVDRKTARRYVAAVQAVGLSPSDGPEALTDAVLGAVAERVRRGGHGRAWEILSAHRAFLEEKLDPDLDLTLTEVHNLFVRHTGEAIPYRTLHRFCVQELGHKGERVTVRVEDCGPGEELQVDFGRMGIMFDPETSRRRVLSALIFTAVFSRHMFVWPTFTQSLADVISAFEGRVGLLRRRLQGRHPRQHQGDRDRSRSDQPAPQRRLSRIRAVPRLRRRPDAGAKPLRQAEGRADRLLRAQLVLQRRALL